MKTVRAILALLAAKASSSSADWVKTRHVNYGQDDYFGRAIALAPDLLVVGAPYTSKEEGAIDTGAAHFYNFDVNVKKIKNTELELLHEIYGDQGGNEFGYAVDVSADSKTVIIGAPLKQKSEGSTVEPGSVKVFHFNDTLGKWELMGKEVTGASNENEHFGRSVAISDDGLVIIVGASDFDVLKRGRAEVFEYNKFSDEWIQKGYGIEGHAVNAKLGMSVAIVYNKDYVGTEIGRYFVAVGGPMWKEGKGIVQVFHFDDDLDDWDQIGKDITGHKSQDQFGHCLSLGFDSFNQYLYVASGAPSVPGYYDGDVADNNEKSNSHVQVFGFDTTDEFGINWDLVGEMIKPVKEGDGTGKAVVISADGMRLAVGSPNYEHDKGIVRVYDFDRTTKQFTMVGDMIKGESESGFGSAVALSGLDLAVGSPYRNNVQLYRFDGDTLYDGHSSKNKNDEKSYHSQLFFNLFILVIVGALGVFVFRRVRTQNRGGHTPVGTEEKADEWPYSNIYSTEERRRIAELRRLDAQNSDDSGDLEIAEKNVDRVVLHGMIRNDSQSNDGNADNESSDSDSDNDDISYGDNNEHNKIV